MVWDVVYMIGIPNLVILRSLSGKYPWERYEPPYPPSYGLNCTTTVSSRRIALAFNGISSYKG